MSARIMIDGSFDPMLKISVGGVLIEFEMHPQCGPTLLDKKGRPKGIKAHPQPFLFAVSQWAKQGKRMEGGLCRWDHDPKPIVTHLSGRNWQMLGCEPAEIGN